MNEGDRGKRYLNTDEFGCEIIPEEEQVDKCPKCGGRVMRLRVDGEIYGWYECRVIECDWRTERRGL